MESNPRPCKIQGFVFSGLTEAFAVTGLHIQKSAWTVTCFGLSCYAGKKNEKARESSVDTGAHRCCREE